MLGSAGSFAAIENSQFTYRVGEKTFTMHIETSASPTKATVFIIHDWDELTEDEKSRAKMLSDLGFNAITIDLFGVDAKLESRDGITEKPVPCIKTVRSFEHGCQPPLMLV